jgi:hypothetical protein
VRVWLERVATRIFTLPAFAMSVVLDVWMFTGFSSGREFVTRFELTPERGGIFVMLVACAAAFPVVALLVPLGLRDRRARLAGGRWFLTTTLFLHVGLGLAVRSEGAVPLFAAAVAIELLTLAWARQRWRALRLRAPAQASL